MEETGAGGIGRSGHRLEISPSGLLNEAIADGDFVARVSGGSGSGRVDGSGGGGGGGGKDVFEGGVGLRRGLEGEEPQVNRRWRWRRGSDAVLRRHGGGGNQASAAEI